MTSRRWQKARVLPGNPTLPAGTELWVDGLPEPMPAEVRLLARPNCWRPLCDAEDHLMRTHLVLPGGWPLYTRLSQVELIADFREEVTQVDAMTIPGIELLGLLLGRDPG